MELTFFDRTGKHVEIEKKNLEVLRKTFKKLDSCRDAAIDRINVKVDEKVDEELYLMDYDDELNEEEITQQQQQTASTSPINTGSSTDLIYSMMQYYMSQFFF